MPIHYQIYLHHEFQKIKNSLEIDIKSKIHGIPDDQFSKIRFFKDFEIHGKAFIDGEDFYYNLSDEERFDVVDRLLSLTRAEDIKIVAAVTDKQLYQANTGAKHHSKMHVHAYTELVNCISHELEKTNSYAFIICDDGKPSEINHFRSALKNPGNQRVYPDLQVKLSHDKDCNLIQLADLINFITSVHFRDLYGFPPRKRHHARIIDFYATHLQPKIITWEYK